MNDPLPISKLVAIIGDENIQVQNVAHNLCAATEAELAFALKFRDMIQRELPKLYDADEVTVEQTKSYLDVQRFTQN